MRALLLWGFLPLSCLLLGCGHYAASTKRLDAGEVYSCLAIPRDQLNAIEQWVAEAMPRLTNGAPWSLLVETDVRNISLERGQINLCSSEGISGLRYYWRGRLNYVGLSCSLDYPGPNCTVTDRHDMSYDIDGPRHEIGETGP